MKVEQHFGPVTITLESQEEVAVLIAMIDVAKQPIGRQALFDTLPKVAHAPTLERASVILCDLEVALRGTATRSLLQRSPR
jgi:hypothetical protein